MPHQTGERDMGKKAMGPRKGVIFQACNHRPEEKGAVGIRKKEKKQEGIPGLFHSGAEREKEGETKAREKRKSDRTWF